MEIHQLALSTMILLLSMIFTQMNHPMAMGLMLLMQTALITLMTGMMTQSFWFSYILFLVFLGGMLVLFIYVTALASNEMFSMSPKLMIMMMMTTMMTMMMMYKSSYWLTEYSTMEMNLINNVLMGKENLMPLIKLYNNPTSPITMMLIMYLFLTLIAIVKITNIFQGALRQKN
uniref:NADH-ubiquinone oxidoreductase chain 6 n=1 Tax=Grylloblatta sculleni TaxID=357321 RepID=Q2Q1L1_9NEOP|nr:NADH dehydrogenase subunit 6 [Grylloblatta sculleni]